MSYDASADALCAARAMLCNALLICATYARRQEALQARRVVFGLYAHTPAGGVLPCFARRALFTTGASTWPRSANGVIRIPAILGDK